jgi:predicted negative regulator of RcsB-dependent stress response
MFKVFDLSSVDDQKKAEVHIKFMDRLVVGLIITVVLLLFTLYFFWSEKNKCITLAEKQYNEVIKKAASQQKEIIEEAAKQQKDLLAKFKK